MWRGRVSPVFDVAGQFLVAELVDGIEVSRREHPLSACDVQQRVAQLAELRVQTLICGAISQPLEALLTEGGIKVYGGICGHVDDVLKAFATGTLDDSRFAMPGWCGRRRRRVRGGCQRGRWRSDG